MNKTEKLGFEWLQKQGYRRSYIKFNCNTSPDFVCFDGKRFEVKKLYKKDRALSFSSSQIKQLKDTDIILVFNDEELVYKFLWKDRKKIPYNIHIKNVSKNTSIPISFEVKETLRKLKRHSKETYGEIIKRIILTNSSLK